MLSDAFQEIAVHDNPCGDVLAGTRPGADIPRRSLRVGGGGTDAIRCRRPGRIAGEKKFGPAAGERSICMATPIAKVFVRRMERWWRRSGSGGVYRGAERQEPWRERISH